MIFADIVITSNERMVYLYSLSTNYQVRLFLSKLKMTNYAND